jgi:hypothetical protein
VTGYLLSACALAGDDPRATKRCEELWNYYYDLNYQWMADYWAPTPGGLANKGYQFGRWPMMHQSVGLFGRNGLAEGQIDILGPYYWRTANLAYLWTPPVRWNQMPYDAGNTGDPYTSSSLAFVPTSALLNPGTPETAYALYWYRNLSGMHTHSRYATATEIMRAPWVAAYHSESAAGADFRPVQNPWTFNTTSDVNPETYYGLVISKTGWTPTDSMVLAFLGVSEPADHTGDQGSPTPGLYSIHKGSKVLLGGDSAAGVTASSSSTSNYFEIGGAANTRNDNYTWWFQSTVPSTSGGQQNKIEYPSANSQYVYARGNFRRAFSDSLGVIRSYRHFLHLKEGREYVIVFDDHATVNPKQFRTWQNYHRTYDSASLLLANAGYTDIVFKKPTLAQPSPNPSTAMVSTKVLFPDGSTPAASEKRTTNSDRVEYNWGTSRTSAQMISVHRVALGTSDVMPPVSMVNVQSGILRGVQIDDGDDSRVVLFTSDGTLQDRVTFTTGFTGTGKILVAGSLVEGSYNVYRNGVLEFQTSVGADATLMFDGIGGANVVWMLMRTDAPMTPVMGVSVESLSFEQTANQAAPPAQVFQVTCSGGSCTAVAEESCSWMSVSPSSGSTPHMFTVAVDPSGMAPGSYRCDIRLSAGDATGSPKTVPVNLLITESTIPVETLNIVTETMPVATAGSPYGSSLTATGGTPPYVWSLESGNLPEGLELLTTGEIVGTALSQEAVEVMIKVTDSGNPSQFFTRTIVFVVEPSSERSLSVRPTGATGTKAIIRYGKPGLSAQATCSAVLSDTSTYSSVLESITDNGGPSRRAYVFGAGTALEPGRQYYARVTCGSETVSTQVVTPPATTGTRVVKLLSKRPAAIPVAFVEVEYGSGPQLGSSSTQTCTATCNAEITVPSNSVLYVRRTYRSASNQILARGLVEVIAVP